MRHLLIAAVVLAAVVLALPSPASADAPGPTDFRTEVEAIEPATDAFEIEIIGGDSFVLLRQQRAVTIDIVGYQGEPYLRFLPDGTVEQNRRSPAVYLNEERYGTDDDLPPIADAEAAPEWETVGSGGTYAWHDHRAHWMLESTPFGKGPGDQILEGVVPVFVDGDEVDITVASFWEPSPSPLPLIAGTVLGAAAAVMIWRRRSLLGGALLVAGVLAAVIGGVQYLSLPSETEPELTLILLPAVAVVVAVAMLISKRPATSLPLAIGGASALISFAALRLPGMLRAILPTDLPFALDRAASPAIAVSAMAVLVVAAIELSRLLQDPRAAEVR